VEDQFPVSRHDRSRRHGDGLGTRRVAETLHLSVKTVESHRARIKEKLGLKSGIELVQRAVRILTEIVAIDENLSLWRYRHALMVNRMIGSKIGTGGSSGQDYLKRTVEAHRIFIDYFNLSTYLVPRSMLPPLPDTLTRELGFHYSA
jgi:tryptophan 2,3-dioxygenase